MVQGYFLGLHGKFGNRCCSYLGGFSFDFNYSSAHSSTGAETVEKEVVKRNSIQLGLRQHDYKQKKANDSIFKNKISVVAAFKENILLRKSIYPSGDQSLKILPIK
jgi:hypothetical protein